jgi:hypothetical protein
MKYMAGFAAFVVFGLCLELSAKAENERLRPKAKPLIVISGANSHVMKPLYKCITTPNELTHAWASHLGPNGDSTSGIQIEVDFDRCLVVVIFRGEKVNTRGIQIDSLLVNANSVVIRFDEKRYQSGRDASDKSPLPPPERPYAFVVLPKTEKTIILEENNQHSKDESPQWKECARLEAGSPTG